MKRLAIILVIISSSAISSCESDKEDPGIDCSESDLSIDVIEFVKSDCDVPGSVSLEATGGEGDYSYSLDGTSFQESTIFDNLFAGNFVFSVKDDVGCIANVPFTLESEPTGITLNLTADESNCISNTGSITAQATGGVGTLSYSLDGGTFNSAISFSGISPGDHTVTVKDEDDCSVSKTVQVVTNTSLARDIMPIVMKDCAISGCHNGSQFPRLTTASEVRQNAARIRSETQTGSMPRDRTLTQEEIDLIACWVDDGAEDN